MAGGVVDPPDARPKGGGVAHATTFGASVESASREVVGFEFSARFADRHDFPMGAGILSGKNAVIAFANNLFIFYDHCAERSAGAFDESSDAPQFDGALHEVNMGGAAASHFWEEVV